MLVEEFVDKFSLCFSHTDPIKIQISTEFRTLEEWGSMMALIVMAMIDAEYGVIITPDELRAAVTVGDLYHLVLNK